MKKLYLIILSLLIFTFSFAQEESAKKAFSYLNWIETSDFQTYFGYENSSFTLINKSCDKLDSNHILYDAENYPEKILLGVYKNSSMNNSVYILFSMGYSVDPMFAIINDNIDMIWSVDANEMCIKNNGIIYTSGHSNKMFNDKRKWNFKNNKVTEVIQPYLHVGIKGKLLKPVKLYSQKYGGEVIATLPAGYDIEILLAEDSFEEGKVSVHLYYLAKSAFGLVGWLRLTDKDVMNPIVDGLRFMGD